MEMWNGWNGYTGWMGDRVNDPLTEAIGKAINGEYNAIRKYGRLAELAPGEKERRIIRSIREDEERHYAWLTAYYGKLTGGHHAPVVAEPLPQHYKEGLADALEDELNDAKFYLNLSQGASELGLKQFTLYTAMDEQRHATWFHYFWNKA